MTTFADSKKIKTNSPQALRSGGRSTSALRLPPLEARHPVSNQAAQKFAQTCPMALPSPLSCPFGGICHSCPVQVQTKLTVGEAGDKYEQEADRVAEEVLRMPEPLAPRGERPSHLPGRATIQRECPGPECDEDMQLQSEEGVLKKELSPVEGTPITPEFSHRLAALRGGGQPLSPSLRSFFEPRFGYDFSQVRVHTGGQATEMAGAVKARAFTLGRNVVFNEREFAPETLSGKRLIAHELTHVVQQQGGLAQFGGNFRKGNMVSGTAPPGQVMRTITYGGGCSARQEEVERNIPRAQRSAARWARVGAASLEDPDRVARLLRRHFDIAATDTAAVTQIRGSFSSIASHLEADDFSYDCIPSSDSRCQEPDGPYNGFARAGGFLINFCDPFPYQDFFGHKSLIDTLLHEAAHAHDTNFNHDTYEHEDDYPGPNPLTNADSYAGFARDAALGRWGYGMPSVELTLGAVMSATPTFYIAVGATAEVGGPALDIFNMIAGTRLFYTQEGEHLGHFGGTADVGFRVNPIRQRVYVDLTTGAFLGLDITDLELISGIASRVSAGYRGESMDLGLELSHLWDLVGDEHLVIVGVRGAFRVP